jgi:hypothetical protein
VLVVRGDVEIVVRGVVVVVLTAVLTGRARDGDLRLPDPLTIATTIARTATAARIVAAYSGLRGRRGSCAGSTVSGSAS